MARVEAPLELTANSSSTGSRAAPQHPDGYQRAARTFIGPTLYGGPALTLYGVFVLWPLVRVVMLSFDRWDGYGPQVFVGLSNFADLAADPVFQLSLRHSIFWELGAIVLVTCAAFLLALVARGARGRRAALAVLFFPPLLPPTVLAAIWTLIYSPIDGLLNATLRACGAGALTRAWLGSVQVALPALFVAWAWAALGMGTLIFWVGLRGIGREYLEIAIVEGAGSMWRLRHVLLPGVRRSAGIVVLLNAALASTVFDLVFVTTGGGPGYATMLLPIDMYGRAFGGQTGSGAAVATVQMLLGLLLLSMVLVLFRGEDWHGEGNTDLRAVMRVRMPGTILLWLLTGAVLVPLAWVAAISLGGSQTVGINLPEVDPRSWDGSSFAGAWSAGIGSALTTSTWLAVLCVAGTLFLAMPAAFALAQLPIARGVRHVVLVILLVGLFQPTPVTIIPLFSLLGTLGLLDTSAGILLPEVARTMPFGILVLWTAVDQIPAEILAVARVDGASAWQLMVRVVVPLVRPALIVVAIWAFVTSWNEYLLPTLVSQDGSFTTVPTLLASFVGRFDTQYALLAAGALLALAPLLAVYLALAAPAAIGFVRLQRKLS